MILTISPWFGRLGNNIKQILRAIQYANIKGYNIIQFPPHPLLSSRTITLNNPEILNLPNISNTFFYIAKDFGIADPASNIYREYYQTYIRPIFKMKWNDIPTYSDRLYIHIRSGDTFDSNPNSWYTPAPLAFYLHCIYSKKWSKVVIIYEDDRHPCINYLKQNIHDVLLEFQSDSLNNDILRLMEAEHLAISTGSFDTMMYLMNDKLTNIYAPENMLSPSLFIGVDTHIFPMSGYTKLQEWKNTTEQRNLILTYKN